MSKLLLPLAALVVLSIHLRGQSVSLLMGSRSKGMGYASSCISDEWALFNNIGGLAKLEHPTTSFSYDAVPSFTPFNRIAALFATPLKYGVAGLSLFRFGDDLYNEQVISLAFSNSFGITSLGLKINYIQYRADGFGTKGALTLSFGGITRLTDQITIGSYITNLNQPKISSTDDERIPTRLTAGILFSPVEKVSISAELEKDIGHRSTLKGGIEYRISKKFSARTGFNLRPNAAFIGAGFNTNRFVLDYAYQYNSLLGSSHQASVGYPFKRKKK